MKCPVGVFDSAQLAVLQTSFERTCNELGVEKTDVQNRDAVAEAIMDLARVSQYDSELLLNCAATRIIK
jgi:hypothetical protein